MATIAGIVIDGSSQRPIDGASLLAGGSLIAHSGVNGQFSALVKPGRGVSLRASKPGYVGGDYGMLSPYDGPVSVDLPDGAVDDGVILRLWRGAVVAGDVRDDQGDPVVGALVELFRVRSSGDRPALFPEPKATTDDRGVFRVSGIPPGRYLLAVRLGSQREGAVRESPPVFYPAVLDPGAATTLTVQSGDDTSGLSVRVPVQSGGVVSGTVIGLDRRWTSARVTLSAAVTSLGAPALDDEVVVHDQEPFSFANVAPGAYLLRAVALPADSSGVQGKGLFYAPRDAALDEGDASACATAETDTAEQAPAGVMLTLHECPRIAGHVVFDPVEDRPPPPLPPMPVLLDRTDAADIGRIPLARTAPDGSFRTAGLPPGPYWLAILPAALRAWTLAGLRVDGLEAAEGITVEATDVRNVDVILTDRPTEVTGRVSDAVRRPVDSASVYIFPVDRRLRRNRNLFERVRETTTVLHATYRFQGLPPGTYFIVARPGGAGADWMEDAALDRLAALADRVDVPIGGHRVVDLTLAGAAKPPSRY